MKQNLIPRVAIERASLGLSIKTTSTQRNIAKFIPFTSKMKSDKGYNRNVLLKVKSWCNQRAKYNRFSSAIINLCLSLIKQRILKINQNSNIRIELFTHTDQILNSSSKLSFIYKVFIIQSFFISPNGMHHLD